ncbi:MAG: hypothetical protein IT233_06135 [Bacteroidia bacterium]|nr:hypothetical protein [Bacteroidia bacterium]
MANQSLLFVQVIRTVFIGLTAMLLGSFYLPPYNRTIDFSGMQWQVKHHSKPEGPGPNYFSDHDSSVWVDASGRLHLRLRYSDGRWWCAEVIGMQPVGTGILKFAVEGLPENWDPQCVLGLFTWSTEKIKHHGEIDIEYSLWGKKKNKWNLQFVVQPHKKKQNKFRFTTSIHQPKTHEIIISGKAVAFSTSGVNEEEKRFVVRKKWYPEKKIFPRINLWLYQGIAPEKGESVEVIITSFKFLPSF